MHQDIPNVVVAQPLPPTAMTSNAIEWAATFALCVLREACSDDEYNLTRSALLTNLILQNKKLMVTNHIANLFNFRELNKDSREKIPMIGIELANTSPYQVLGLAEEFADALQRDKNWKSIESYLMPLGYKSTLVSRELEKLKAPALAQLFMPVLS